MTSRTLDKLIKIYCCIAIVCFAYMALYIQPLIHFNDEGSCFRHLTASSTLSFMVSSVVPTMGDDAVIWLGNQYEKSTNKYLMILRIFNEDIKRDLNYNLTGSTIGNRFGTGAFLINFCIWVIMYHRWKKYDKARKILKSSYRNCV